MDNDDNKEPRYYVIQDLWLAFTLGMLVGALLALLGNAAAYVFFG